MGRGERRERGRQESEEAGRGWLRGPWGEGEGPGSGGRGPKRTTWEQGGGNHLSPTLGLELNMGTGLGINYKALTQGQRRGHRTGYSTHCHPQPPRATPDLSVLVSTEPEELEREKC